jgi:hypothetical protein
VATSKTGDPGGGSVLSHGAWKWRTRRPFNRPYSRIDLQGEPLPDTRPGVAGLDAPGDLHGGALDLPDRLQAEALDVAGWQTAQKPLRIGLESIWRLRPLCGYGRQGCGIVAAFVWLRAQSRKEGKWQGITVNPRCIVEREACGGARFFRRSRSRAGSR